MEKYLYVIIKDGVYRHEIVGVCTNFNKADKIARESLLKERDCYHSFQIVKCLKNKKIQDGENLTIYRHEKDNFNLIITEENVYNIYGYA